VIEADPTACYRLERNGNPFFDDDITLQVDPTTGLLQSASATSTDESIAAFANLAAGAASALTFGASLGASGSGGARGNPTAEQLATEKAAFEIARENAVLSKFSVLVDPHHPSQTCYVVQPDSTTQPAGSKGGIVETNKIYAKYVIELTRLNQEETQASAASATNNLVNGIAIRTPIPHEITVTGTFYKEGRAFPPQTTTQIVFLPDDENDYFLPLARIPLVTTSTKVVLVNGMVQTLQRSRPSIVNAIAGVPKNILSALIPIPLAINQNNVQNSKPAPSTGTGGSAPATSSP
jgi:hypothetical protein